jgi:hypothetical protein
MQDKIEKQIDELIGEFKGLGIDFFGEMKKGGVNEKTSRCLLRALHDKELFKEAFGAYPDEYFLMQEGLTQEEANYVLKHPCLENAESKCDYHKEHDKCVPWGCTNLNGWLYFKTSVNEKRRPNYKAWSRLPKETLNLSKEDVKVGTADEKIKDFLDEY